MFCVANDCVRACLRPGAPRGTRSTCFRILGDEDVLYEMGLHLAATTSAVPQPLAMPGAAAGAPPLVAGPAARASDGAAAPAHDSREAPARRALPGSGAAASGGCDGGAARLSSPRGVSRGQTGPVVPRRRGYCDAAAGPTGGLLACGEGHARGTEDRGVRHGGGGAPAEGMRNGWGARPALVSPQAMQESTPEDMSPDAGAHPPSCTPILPACSAPYDVRPLTCTVEPHASECAVDWGFLGAGLEGHRRAPPCAVSVASLRPACKRKASDMRHALLPAAPVLRSAGNCYKQATARRCLSPELSLASGGPCRHWRAQAEHSALDGRQRRHGNGPVARASAAAPGHHVGRADSAHDAHAAGGHRYARMARPLFLRGAA